MGEASGSAASTSAINATGGNVSENAPNYVAWIVIGVVALLGLLVFSRRKK